MLQLELEFQCAVHTRYRAKHPPRADCEPCRNMYDVARLVRGTHRLTLEIVAATMAGAPLAATIWIGAGDGRDL